MNDEFKNLPSLGRWMRNATIAAAVRIDDSGKPLGLLATLPLFDPLHPQHDRLLAAVAPHLPDDVRDDFFGLPLDELQRRQKIEAVVNRIRQLMGLDGTDNGGTSS